MALGYRDVKDIYDELHDAGAVSESLPEWSAKMNKLTGSDVYSAGLHDNLLKRASVGLDRLIEKTGIPEATGEFGRNVGEAVGAPEAGEQIGRGAGRMLVNFAPLLIPGAGIPATVARLGGTALLSGAESYTATDSPMAALISGATAAAAPGVAGKAEQLALKKLGLEPVAGRILERGVPRAVEQYFPETLGQKVVSAGAGQAAAAGLFAGAGAAEQVASGQPVTSPLSVENLLNLTLGQAPFAAIHLGGRALGLGKTPAQRAEMLQKAIDVSEPIIKAQEQAKKQADASFSEKTTPQEPVTPEVMREINLRRAALRGEQIAIKDDPTLTDEQKFDATNMALLHEAELAREEVAPTNGLFGDVITPDPTGRQELLGREVRRNKDGSWRAIFVTDDPSNPEELRGKIIGYSTKDEKAPLYGLQSMERTPVEGLEFTPEGTARFDLPPVQWRTVHTLDEWNSRFPPRKPKYAEATPQLPLQERPLTDEQFAADMETIKQAQVVADGAQTPADLQQAMVGVNSVEHQNDLRPTNDTTLRSKAQQLSDSELVDDKQVPKKVVKSAANRTARTVTAKKKSQRELEREAPELTPEQTAEVAAMFGGEGYSVQTLDKLSHTKPDDVESQPVSDHVADAVFEAVKSPVALEAFNRWEGREDTTLAKDAADYHDLVQQYGSLSKVPLAEAADFLNSRLGTTTWDEGEVKDFVNRPHVKAWELALEKHLNDTRKFNAVPDRPIGRIPAGRGFVYSLAQYDPATNKLGKHTLPRSGVIPETQFKNIGGIGKPVNAVEFPLYKLLVPEAFTEGNVNVPLLVKGLQEHGPTIETRTLTDIAQEKRAGFTPQETQAEQRQRQIQHEFETAGYALMEDNGWHIIDEGANIVDPSTVSPILQRAFAEYQDLADIVPPGWDEIGANRPGRLGDVRYKFLAPKPEEQMPGYVEGLVRVPGKEVKLTSEQARVIDEADMLGQGHLPPRTARRFGIQYQGPHFGPEDTNVIAFYRGYEETLPNGEKAFHVIEVQSDWAQREREKVKFNKEGRVEGWTTEKRGDQYVIRDSEGNWIDGRRFGQWENGKTPEETWKNYREHVQSTQHPLLQAYEQLALKAAINHAQEVGATKLILSDAETAMMTEGHDLGGPAPDSYYVYQGSVEEGLQALRDAWGEQGQTIKRDGNSVTIDQYGQDVDIGEVRDGKLHISGNALASDEANRPKGFVRPERSEADLRQAVGMRLHYDKLLPSVAEKLTGSKGEPVDLGMHKNALEGTETESYANRAEAEARVKEIKQAEPGAHVQLREHAFGYDIWVGTPKGSPVFKGPEGQPKTNVTGRTYPLEQAGINAQLQGGFSLGERRAAPPTSRTDREPLYAPDNPAETAIHQELGMDKGGVGLVNYLVNHPTNDFYRALGRDLLKFPDALARISAVWRFTEGASYMKPQRGYRGEISFSPGLMYADHEARGYSVAHELIHGLTVNEIDNPVKAPIVRELDEMRVRLIDQLPKDLKQRYMELEQSDWYRRWANGDEGAKAEVDDLSPNDMNLLYGLMNTHEMVSQGFTSDSFRKYMQGLPSEGNVTWFTKFTNTIRRLLGLGEAVTNTAFHDFMSKSSALFEQGDYVASFHNFSNRFFENLGMSPEFVRQNTKRALGLAMYVDPMGTTKESLIDHAIASGGPLRSPEWMMASREVERMFSEGGDNAKITSGLLEETGHPTNSGGLLEFARNALLDKAPHDVLELLPPEAARFVYETAKDAQNILGVAHAATNEGNRGALNLTNPNILHGPLGEALELVRQIRLVEANYDKSVEMVNSMQNVEPAALLDNIVSDIRAAPPWLRQDNEARTGPLKWFFGTAAQIARSDPVTAEYFDKAYALKTNAREMLRRITHVMGTDPTGNTPQIMTKEGLQRSIDAAKSPKTLDAIEGWMYINNVEAKRNNRGVTLVPDSHPEVMKLLAGLSPKERQNVVDTVNKAGIMTQKMHVETLEKMSEIGVTRAAGTVMAGEGTDSVKSLNLARQMWEAVSADRNDPQQNQMAEATLNALQQQLKPQTYLELLKDTQNEVSKYNLWKDYFNDNPYWASAQRREPWLIEFRQNGRTVQAQGSSRQEVLDMAKGKKILKEPWNQYAIKGEDTFIPPSLSQETFARLRQLEDNQIADMKRRGVSEEVIANFRDMSIVTQFAREQAANVGAIPDFVTPPRKLSKGAEYLPWLYNHFATAEQTSNYWTRQLFRAQADLHINSPELAPRPDLVKLLKDHRDMTLTPDPTLIRNVNRFVTTWYMGLSPASAIMNGFQTITGGVAELTNLSGKMLDSYRLWASAVKATAKYAATGKWETREMDAFMNSPGAKAERGFSMWDEDAMTQEKVAVDWKRALMKQKQMSMPQKMDNLLGNATNVALWMFKQVESFNRDVMLHAGYKSAIARGMTPEEAAVEAFRINRAVNYGGGKVNRPVGLYSSIPRSVAMLGTNLQGYNLGVLGQLARYIQAGFYRPNGFTPAEVYNARKAGVQMLATQFALAGTLGMPFVSGALALLDKAFPDLEVNKNLRGWMNDIFNSDDKNGSMFTDIAMTGVPSVLGWDMQSRLSMGNMVPGVSEYNGFQPTQLLGPPVALLSNWANGVMRVAQGDPQGAEKFIPPGIKKFTDLLRDDGMARDYKGQPAFKRTLGETAGMILGFNPKRLSDLNAADRMARLSEDNLKRREAQFKQTLAEEVTKGNFGTVRQRLLERAQSDKTYDPVDAARTIAKYAEDMTFPRDLRREGTNRAGTERARLLSTFRIEPTQPTETARLQFRQQVEQRLGVMRQSPADSRLAAVMDALRQQDPTAPRVELRRQAELLLRSPRSRTLASLEE